MTTHASLKRLSQLSVLTCALFASIGQAQTTTEFHFKRSLKGLTVSGAATPAPSPAPATTLVAQLSSTSLVFDLMAVGQTQTKSVMLSNTGAEALALSAPVISGSAFSASSGCGQTLAVGASCQTDITFAPTAPGTANGSVVFRSNATAGPLTLELSGSAGESTASLTAVTNTDFGTLAVGDVATRTFTFTNTSTVPVINVWSSIAGSGITKTAGTTCGSFSNKVTVPAGASCQVVVQYAPTAEAVLASASVTVTSSASNSPTSLALTGSALANLQLLLRADSVLADESGYRLGVTAYGNAAVSSAQARVGSGSLVVDGSGDYAVVAASTGFGFGTGDFTIEAWVYADGLQSSNAAVLDFRASGGGSSQARPTIFFSDNGQMRYFTAGGQPASMVSSAAINTWHHVAYSRASGVGRFFLNGVQVGGNYSDTNNYGSSADLVLGGVGDSRSWSGGYFKGYIDDVRVTKGVGRYVSGFTPPAN